MITTFYPPYSFGGDGIFIYRLSNTLAEQGHEVDVIFCKDSYLIFRSNKPENTFPNHQNITVHGLKSPLGKLSPLLTHQTGYPLLKKRKIERIINSKDFNVIHYHNISLIGGPKLLRPRKQVTLYTLHDYWLVCPMHYLWKNNEELCSYPECVKCSVMFRKIPQLWRYTNLLKKSLRHVDCLISPSNFSLQKHSDFGIQGTIVHMPNFLPLPKQQHGTNDIRGGGQTAKPYFLFVGRLEKIKGLQNLIRIFKDYTKAELWIAGEGSYHRQLLELASGSDNILFLGMKEYHELNALYEHAVSVIVPSIWYEVFGIIIIEAFAMKTPVIAYNRGGPSELIRKSGGGYVYSNNDELVAVLERLRTQPEERNNLGMKGYRAFREHWSEKPHLSKYFELIEAVTLSRRSETETRHLSATAQFNE